MLKKILFFLVFVIAAVVALVFFAGNIVLAKGMEAALGVPVSVEKLNLGLAKGEFGIYGMVIDNPAGFKEKTLASIPEVYVKVSIPELLQKKVHVEMVRVNIDLVTVERSSGTQFNLKQLKPMQAQPQAQPSSAKPSGQKAEAVPVQIDDVRLSLGKVRYIDPTLPSKDFNLGIKDQGMPKVESFAQLVRQIITMIIQKTGLGNLIPDLNNIVPEFGDIAGQVKDQALGAVSGLKDEAGQQVGALKEEVGNALKKFKL